MGKGEYNVQGLNHPADDSRDESSLLQKKKKGWGSDLDADGGEEKEYGGDQRDQQGEFSESQYESDDPNDDEDGYKGEYNVQGLDHPADDSRDESSLLQKKKK